MFDYQKYAASSKEHKIDVEKPKPLDLKPDRASLSTTTTEDELEINEYYLCELFKVFKLLPVVAASCLFFDCTLAILTIGTQIAFTFIPLAFCTSLIWFASSRGVREEKRKLVRLALWFLVVKLLLIVVFITFELFALNSPDEFVELFKFSISTYTLQSVLLVICIHLLVLLLQLHLTCRANEIIRKRDMIYVIPAAKGSIARLRPSIKLVVEKLKNQNLGVQVF